MFRKISFIATVLAACMILSSCQAGFTVRHMELNEDEKRIAALTSDIVEKFVFEKDKVYDISVYLYKDGVPELVGGGMGIDTKGEDQIVLISGRQEDGASFAWSFSDGNFAKGEPIEADGEVSAMVRGVGQSDFTMEEGREYALVYVALSKETAIRTSSTAVFSEWDSAENRDDAMKEFPYAYVITARLSDEPGYK